MAITRSVKRSRPAATSAPKDAEAFINEADPSPPAPTEPPAAEGIAAESRMASSALSSDSDHPRSAKAMQSIRRHMPWAAGAGVLPLPGIDLAGIAAVQLHLMAELADHYGVPFKRDAAKSIAGTLMATLLERSVAGGFGSLAKLIPGVGSVLGLAVLPGLAGAGTYALGRVFLMHFQSGGTFLDFDATKAETHFRAALENAPR